MGKYHVLMFFNYLFWSEPLIKPQPTQHISDQSVHGCYVLSFVLLLGSLSRGQRGGYRAARLRHVEELLLIPGRRDQALMFMTPHHQIEKVIQKLLGNVVGGSMLAPGGAKKFLNLNNRKH